MLVRSGFSLDEIQNMSLDQFNLFLKAIGRQDKREMWRAVVTSLAGARYDDKSLDKLQRQLENK